MARAARDIRSRSTIASVLVVLGLLSGHVAAQDASPPAEQATPEQAGQPQDASGRQAAAPKQAATPAPEAMPDHRGLVCSGSCHSDLVGPLDRPHPEVAQSHCMACHDSNSTRGAFLREQSDGAMCMRCHQQLRRQGPHAHEPAEAGMCTLCHGSHTILPLNAEGHAAPAPCLTCHTDIAERRPVIHSALEDFGCSSCHEPHWASQEFLLKETVGRDPCFNCHVDDAEPLLSYQPTAHGMCTLCHDPHGSEYQASLRAERRRLCLSCHPSVGAGLANSHRGAMEFECTALCHDPHASATPGLLRLGVLDTCGVCHPDAGGEHIALSSSGAPHPIDEDPDPNRPGRTVDCTACHVAHGSENPSLFRYATERTQLCAECHSSAPIGPAPAFLEMKQRELKDGILGSDADGVDPAH